jgi:hypothetical protein
MSKQLADAAVAQFDGEVKHAYQGMGMLRPTVRNRNGVVGSTHRFPKMGKGTATPRISQTDVVPMNIAHTSATATLEDWNAPEYTDIFDQQKVNYSERQELATVIAGAIGRREDQLIIDAIDAASTTLTVSENIGGSNTGLNTTKLRRAMRLFDDQAAPSGQRYFLGHAIGKEQLLGETEPTSGDFNTVRALVNGEITSFVGFQFMWMETRDEGGLTLAANVRTNYAWHGGPMGSVGMATGINFNTEVNYIADKTSWLANGLFTAGAVTIDALGVAEISTYEA